MEKLYETIILAPYQKQQLVFLHNHYPIDLFFLFLYTLPCMSTTTPNPKNRKRNKTHGFLVRSKTPGGKNVLRNRRRKGRAALAV